jgi:hypothetical protein
VALFATDVAVAAVAPVATFEDAVCALPVAVAVSAEALVELPVVTVALFAVPVAVDACAPVATVLVGSAAVPAPVAFSAGALVPDAATARTPRNAFWKPDTFDVAEIEPVDPDVTASRVSRQMTSMSWRSV